MFDITTFGSATWDIFLKPKKIQTVTGKKFLTGKGICFNLGSKVEIEKIFFSSGGGGTNTATTFANQGFKTAYCGSIGSDLAGQAISGELKSYGIDERFIKTTKAAPTNHSIVISGLKEDRTIFVYRGASEILDKDDIPWRELKAKWLYLAPLSGKLCGLFNDIVNFAAENKIKVAANPGNCQLSMPPEKLKEILKKVDILILNQEEASTLTKIPYDKEIEIFKKIDEICPGIAIMTKGPFGVVVSDGEYLYKSGILKSEVIDRTGAGDSFAAGFVSGFIQKNGDIEYAIQLGAANSTACLKEWGAKKGLLKKGEKFAKIKVEKESCLKNNFCQYKRK